jgi:hypothetical protein
LANPADVRAGLPFQERAEKDIKALAYSEDGTRLAVLEGENIIRVHAEHGAAQKFTAPVTRVTTLTFTPDPRYLAFGTSDADIWLLDLRSGVWTRLDQLHDTGIKSIRFGGEAGAKFMVSADTEGRIMLWRRAGDTGPISYNRLGRLLPTKGSRLPMALSDNGALLLVGGPTPRMFDLRMESLLALACRQVARDAHTACRDVPP